MPLVYRDGELIEKHQARPKGSPKSPNIISDIQPFQTQDGVAITSRKDLRAYEQANGVKQIGTDWTGSERPKFWEQHRANERARGR